jgi:hypothetical protein
MTRLPPSTSMRDALRLLSDEPGSDSNGLSLGLSIASARFESSGAKLDRIGRQLSPSQRPKRFESSATRRTT